ncbi:MAG TPA: hypothetical protein VFH18_02605, partial [Erysipelotrichaceae bacterium]|nr:hypothetical protein [Erysipelotrichaceae bacterium]
MKKLLVLLVVSMLALTGLTGCAAKTYKFGTGSFTEVSGRAAVAAVEAVAATKDKPAVEAAEAVAGRVRVTTTYAAVLLDDAGKIVYVDIDSAQNEGTFDEMGAVVKAEAAPTKTEKGADYGMVANSAIGKEWFEQMAALEAYFVGKTLDEIKAIELDEEAVAVAEDLKASVSVGIDAYIAAVEKAVANAVEVKGVAKVAVGSVASVSGRAAKPAVAAAAATATTPAVEAAEAVAGRIQTNVTYMGVALDKDGKVLVALLDVAQNQGTFDTTGAIVKAEAAPTKVEK